MRKFYTVLFTLFFSILFTNASSQVLNFNFQGSNGDEATWPSSTQAPGVQMSTISRGPGVTAIANADRFNSRDWTTAATLNLNDYIEFTITPNAGYSVSLSQIVLQHQRSSTGPKSFVVRTSLDGFAADATNTVNIPDVNTNQTSTFNFPSVIVTTTPIVIRIYAWNAETAAGTWGPGESGDGNDLQVIGMLNILPVKFMNVRGVLRDGKTEISWSNATESDIQYYAVEHSSNSQSFIEILRADPIKNNGSNADYKRFDLQPKAINFYRIKAVETNGRIIYSNIIRIEINKSANPMSVYPNPAIKGSQINVQLNGLATGNYVVRVFNAGAQLISEQKINFPGNSLTQTMGLNNWQKGVYIIEITGAGTKTKQQFLIQ